MSLSKKILINKIKKASMSEDDDLLSQLIWQAFSDINKTTRLKLDNKADLTSLVPLAFFAVGIIEIVRRPSAPKWNEWMWYAYSTFRDLNTEKRKVPHFHTEGYGKKE